MNSLRREVVNMTDFSTQCVTLEGLLASLLIRREGSYKIDDVGSKAACHFLFAIAL
jgi:hypothetical protein